MMQNLTRRDVFKVGAGLLLPWGTVNSSLLFAEEPKDKKDPYGDAVLVPGKAPRIQPGSFTIAVLPDTQHYSQKFPETFLQQTRWIVDEKEERNIACVLHLGDITNTSAPAEWEIARQAMRQLDGEIPYFIVPGNHDYLNATGRFSQDRATLFNDYFPVSHYQDRPTFGGTYDKEPERMENSFHRFSVGDRRFLVLALEYGPREDVVRWANEVVGKHPQHAVILITHAYMYYDDTRYDWKKYGKNQRWSPHNVGMDGEELWQNLVSRHENFILTLNGHVLEDGLGKLTTQTPGGRDVHQMLVNYQMRPRGGDGWLRLIEFLADGRTMKVYDYSPKLNQRNESAQNRFTLEIASVS